MGRGRRKNNGNKKNGRSNHGNDSSNNEGGYNSDSSLGDPDSDHVIVPVDEDDDEEEDDSDIDDDVENEDNGRRRGGGRKGGKNKKDKKNKKKQHRHRSPSPLKNMRKKWKASRSKDDSEMALRTQQNNSSGQMERRTSKDDSELGVAAKKVNSGGGGGFFGKFKGKRNKGNNKKGISKSASSDIDDAHIQGSLDGSVDGDNGARGRGDSFDSVDDNSNRPNPYGSSGGSNAGGGGGGARRGRNDTHAASLLSAPLPSLANAASRAVSFDVSAMMSTTAGVFGSGNTQGYASSRSNNSLSDVETAPQRTHEGQRAGFHSQSISPATRGRKVRVRPYHCFPDSAKYMTEERLYANSVEPSTRVQFLKSYLQPCWRSMKKTKVPDDVKKRFGTPADDGRIGSLRVEVLGCVSLARTKPDVAVFLICGDAAFCTDVIHGYRSPMWPNVSRRCAVFPLHHAYARLYVGVFDVRYRTNKDNDVFCGRVVVDVPGLRPNTEYDITYPLRASSFVYDRHKRGVVRLRLSVHWFSERAAILSYFKSPQPEADGCRLVEGAPAIPCSDPKTFRNVAITVYGQDLPGKYTRTAFRATMREFNLYQQNARYLIKHMVMDACLYEKPIISFYLFCGAMYCCVYSSIRIIPTLCIGYVLMRYLDNYRHFVQDQQYHLGYKPLTLWEVIRGLLFLRITGQYHATSFQPLTAKKKAKRRTTKNSRDRATAKLRKLDAMASGRSAPGDEEIEILPLDHREFPFSERDAYPKFSIEDALAPSSKKNSGNTRQHGRLSIYYSATPATESDNAAQQQQQQPEEEEEDSESSVSADETVMSETNMGDDMFMELEGEEGEDAMEDENEEEVDQVALTTANSSSNSIFSDGVKSRTRRVRAGPPQNTDTKGRKVPPQVHLVKIEKMFHKVSMGISQEKVHAPPVLTITPGTLQLEGTEAGGPGSASEKAALDAQAAMAMKKKKMAQDEFDRLLGLQQKTANPILRIASSFLGPLMRMIRIVIFIVRIMFHASAWRDPFLSFWLFVFLLVLFFVSIVFPWRLFCFFISILCLGPQNIAVRKYLEKRRARKAEEKRKAQQKQNKSSGYGYEYETQIDNSDSMAMGAEGGGHHTNASYGESKDAKRGGNFLTRKINMVAKKTTGAVVTIATVGGVVPIGGMGGGNSGNPEEQGGGMTDMLNSADEGHIVQPTFVFESSNQVQRPPFEAVPGSATSSSSRRQPRAVAVPYSKVKKDRFFDWPPDPTVSRATPIFAPPETTTPAASADAKSSTTSGAPIADIQVIPDASSPGDGRPSKAGMRRRNPDRNAEPDFGGIPTSINTGGGGRRNSGSGRQARVVASDFPGVSTSPPKRVVVSDFPGVSM